MLKLSGKVIRIHAVNVYKDLTLIKVSTNRNLPEILRRELAFWFAITRSPQASPTIY